MNEISTNIVFLSLGTNQGDRLSNLDNSIQHIEHKCGKILNISSIYETEAWGNTDQEAFLNQVIEISTQLTAHELLAEVLGIETVMGRVREVHWGPRIIDVDILFYGIECFNEPNLIIPHPQLQFRNFVLIPLKEIAPDWVHPLLGKSVEELILLNPDKLAVKKVLRS